MLLGFDMWCVAALGAGPAQAQNSGSPSNPASAVPAPAGNESMGADACASCHEEAAKSLAASPHAGIGHMHGGTGNPCETCHGAGSAHIAAHGDAAKIFNPAKAPRNDVDAEVNQMCSKCHGEMRGPFAYEHGAVKAEGCPACHSAHGSESAHMLRKADIAALCTQCHSPAMATAAHSAKPGPPGAKQCTDCHTRIHGSDLSATFLN